MLSRVADSLYWMSRYLERAEHTARVINCQMDLMLHATDTDERLWTRTLHSLAVDESLHAETTVESLMSDGDCPASIVASIAAARENARQVREQISSEMWEQLNRVYHEVMMRRRDSADQSRDARDYLASIKESCHLFQGVTDATMTHGEGWQFIQVGRYLERSVLLSNLIGVNFRGFNRDKEVTEADYLEWIGLLRSCTAFEAYCKAYTADLQPVRIAEFLVLHPDFPHSVRFSADALEAALKMIGGGVPERRSSRLERLAGRMRATLRFGQIDEIMSGGLNSYLEAVRRQSGQVHGAIHQTYISYPIEAALGT
jgi:uncharacterized alpha-E superfamily protein